MMKLQKASQKSGKVLVLGNDFKNYRSCLTIVRSLGRKGLEVHLGWNVDDDVTQSSRYVTKIQNIPPFRNDDYSWKETLIKIVEKENYDLVVPCNEQATAPLEKYRAELEKFPAIYFLNREAYEIAFDKFKSDKLAKSLGIRVPEEIEVTDLSQLEAVLANFNFPIVLKPEISFNLDSLEKKNYVYKAYNEKELLTCLRFLLKNGDALIQENFNGTGVGCEFLANKGRLLYVFEHVRLHEPLMGGGSSYRKSSPVNPELLDAVKKLLSAMNYTGIGMIEFMYNFNTGDWVFLEINGRFWGSLPLAVAAGADFPFFLYQLRIENRQDFTVPFKAGIYARNTIRDFVWITENFRADKSDPSRNTLPNIQVFKELLRFVAFREKNDNWVIDDIRPALIELRRLGLFIFKKVSHALYNISPFRLWKTIKTRKMLARAKTVLIICYGNIYRSPFAERYAMSVFPDSKRFTSAGYLPKENRRCHQRAVDIADELGVSLADHRSKVVSDEMVKKADIILTFDNENVRILKTKFPYARKKIFYLGSLSFRGAETIEDPVEGNLYTVRNTYKTIIRVIDSAVGAR